MLVIINPVFVTKEIEFSEEKYKFHKILTWEFTICSFL